MKLATRSFTLIVSALLLTLGILSCGDSGSLFPQFRNSTSFAYLQSTSTGATIARPAIRSHVGTARPTHAYRTGVRAASVSIGAGSLNLYVMDLTVGTPTKLNPTPQEFENVQLSADGTKLVFTAFDAANPSYIQVYVADSKLQTITQLTSDASYHVSAAISADGTKIVYDNDDGTLYTIPVTGGTPTTIPNTSSVDAWGPVFTPDGKKVVFTGDVTGSYIYSINVDGTGLTQLSKGTEWDGYPSVSADGTKIVFERDNSSEGEDIAVMSIGGETTSSPVTMLTTTGNNWAPIYAGNKIVFLSWRNNNNYDTIYSMNADGTNPVRLTDPTLESCFNWWED
jgi:Tol biopolymer transport system component